MNRIARMAYDFHDLKTVSICNGEVVLRIPRRWDVWPDDEREGYWGCYEKDDAGNEPDTGTLWIQVDHFDFKGEGKPPVEMTDIKRLAEDMASDGNPVGSPSIESAITPVDQGYRWYRVHDTEEDGEALRFWFSHFFLNKGSHTAIIAFNLVLTHAQMDDPDFVELRDVMAREIGAAFLDPFKTFDERQAEEVFGPLHRCNFDDKVKLVLPEAMGCWPDDEGERENQWYCRLVSGGSHAGMFVTVQPFRLWAEEDGVEGRVSSDMFRKVMARCVADKLGRDRFVDMPQGVIAYDIVDDLASKDDDEDGRSFKNHYWRYMCFSEGVAQLLTVLILLPYEEAETRPYPDLIEYMGRAVRRAEFPSLPN